MPLGFASVWSRLENSQSTPSTISISTDASVGYCVPTEYNMPVFPVKRRIDDVSRLYINFLHFIQHIITHHAPWKLFSSIVRIFLLQRKL